MNKKWAITIIVLALLLLGTAVAFIVLHGAAEEPVEFEITGPEKYACDIRREGDVLRIRFEAADGAEWTVGDYDEDTLDIEGGNGDFRVTSPEPAGALARFRLENMFGCLHEIEVRFTADENGLLTVHSCAHIGHGEVLTAGEGTKMPYGISEGGDGGLRVTVACGGNWLWKSEGDCRITPLDSGDSTVSVFDVRPALPYGEQWPAGKTGQGTVWVGEPAATKEELVVLRIDLTVNGDGSLTVTGHELTNDVPDSTDLDRE